MGSGQLSMYDGIYVKHARKLLHRTLGPLQCQRLYIIIAWKDKRKVLEVSLGE